MRSTWLSRSVVPAFALFAMAIVAAAQQPPPTTRPASPTVEVSSTGAYQAEPDEVDVSWEVTGKEASLKAAYASAQSQADKVRALLRQQGFTPAEAHWSSYRVQPDVDYKTQKVTGYTVTVPLELKFTDFQKIGPLLDAAGSSGLNALRNISFDLKDQQAAKAAAIADGYRQAQFEAEALATAAGRKLGGLGRATVDVSMPVQPRIFGMAAMAKVAPAPTAEFSPQRITVTARVTVVYLLAP